MRRSSCRAEFTSPASGHENVRSRTLVIPRARSLWTRTATVVSVTARVGAREQSTRPSAASGTHVSSILEPSRGGICGRCEPPRSWPTSGGCKKIMRERKACTRGSQHSARREQEVTPGAVHDARGGSRSAASWRGCRLEHCISAPRCCPRGEERESSIHRGKHRQRRYRGPRVYREAVA